MREKVESLCTEAHSFDFDGCMYHRGFERGDNVVEKNLPLLSHIKSNRIPGSQLRVMIGSSRQDFGLDYTGNEECGPGYCFIDIRKITQYLALDEEACTAFDSFLMADIGKKPELDLVAGTAYRYGYSALENNRMLDSLREDPHPIYLQDTSKVTLLYAQMHKLVCDNPGRSIVYHFYDDRKDILTQLTSFFTNNPCLIPNTLTLKMMHYAGKEAKLWTQMQGLGSPEPAYRDHVRSMLFFTIERYIGPEDDRTPLWNVADKMDVRLFNCSIRNKAKAAMPHSAPIEEHRGDTTDEGTEEEAVVVTATVDEATEVSTAETTEYSEAEYSETEYSENTRANNAPASAASAGYRLFAPTPQDPGSARRTMRRYTL